MGIFNKEKFDTGKQTWKTPDIIFLPLDSEFSFETDLACDEENKLCPIGFTEQDESLSKEWVGVNWLNPPFGKVKLWVKKAYEETRKDGTIIVMLIFSKTNTVWWHDYVMRAKEVRLIKGRPKFKGAKHGLPFPLSIVVFQKTNTPVKFSTFELKKTKQTK